MKNINQEIVVLIILSTAALLFLFIFTKYTSDDAFITYRYAKNIIEGNGWSYNIGEKVQGTSSPLFTIISSIVMIFSSIKTFPFIIRFVLFFFSLYSIYLLWKILIDLNRLSRFLVVSLFALYPKVVLINISGMETPIVITLMLLSVLFVKKKSYYSLFIIFGLLMLTRIDSIIWISVLLGVLFIAKENISLKLFSIPVFIYVPWLLFSKIYFGNWLPYSIIAKNISWQHLFPAFDPIRIFSGYFPFQGLEGYAIGLKVSLILILLIPIILESIRMIRDKNILVCFPIFFLTYNLAFSLGKVIMTDWYYLPGYLAYFVTFGFFTHRIIVSKIDNINKGANTIKFSVILLLIISLVLGALRWEKNPAGLFIRQNKQLGDWLKINSRKNESVLVEPIGYIGWYSELYIHDYIGLISPQVIDYRKNHGKSDSWFVNYIRHYKPDYIVLRNWEISNNALFHGYGDGIFSVDEDKVWFEANYESKDWSFKKNYIDSVYLVLYEKVKRNQ